MCGGGAYHRFTQIRLVSSEFYRFTHSHPDSHKLFQIHADFCSPTQNRTLSFRFTETNLDSPHPLQILSISFRFTQSRLDPLQSTLSQSDSLSLSRIYFASLGFTELRFLSGSDRMQTLSDSLILAQIHSYLFRFSQIRSFPSSITPDSDQLRSYQIHYSFSSRFTQTHTDLPRLFNAILISLDLLSLTQIQINSDTLRSTHSRPDSLRLTQMFSDCFNVLGFLLISLISDRFTDPRGKREGSLREKGKREEGFAFLPSPVFTRQPDCAYARTNETKRFPGWCAPPNLRLV